MLYITGNSKFGVLVERFELGKSIVLIQKSSGNLYYFDEIPYTTKIAFLEPVLKFNKSKFNFCLD